MQKIHGVEVVPVHGILRIGCREDQKGSFRNFAGQLHAADLPHPNVQKQQVGRGAQHLVHSDDGIGIGFQFHAAHSFAITGKDTQCDGFVVDGDAVHFNAV